MSVPPIRSSFQSRGPDVQDIASYMQLLRRTPQILRNYFVVIDVFTYFLPFVAPIAVILTIDTISLKFADFSADSIILSTNVTDLIRYRTVY